MVKDKKFLENIAQFCLERAKKLGATDCELGVSNSISESISFEIKKSINQTDLTACPLGLLCIWGKENLMFLHQMLKRQILPLS
jgi:PmbA protein